MCILIERREEFNCFVEFSLVTRNLSLFLYPFVNFEESRDFDIHTTRTSTLVDQISILVNLVNLVGNWEI